MIYVNEDMSNAKVPTLKQDEQDSLNAETIDVYFEKGGLNDVQARYIHEVAKAAVGVDIPCLISIQPSVKPMESEAWLKCLCFSLAFLRRYKMEQTLQTIKLECPKLPKSTGFGKVSELESFWRSLLKTSVALGDKTFDEVVIEYKTALAKHAEANPKRRKKTIPELSDV